jgi:hypothetical protein
MKGKIEGRIEVMGRRVTRSKQLLDNLKEDRGYCRFEEEELDLMAGRNGFLRGYGLVVRRTSSLIT